MITILLIILLLALFGALPTWPYSTGWGYYPSGTLGLLLANSHCCPIGSQAASGLDVKSH